jgi:hypothetical protein
MRWVEEAWNNDEETFLVESDRTCRRHCENLAWQFLTLFER